MFITTFNYIANMIIYIEQIKERIKKIINQSCCEIPVKLSKLCESDLKLWKQNLTNN